MRGTGFAHHGAVAECGVGGGQGSSAADLATRRAEGAAEAAATTRGAVECLDLYNYYSEMTAKSEVIRARSRLRGDLPEARFLAGNPRRIVPGASMIWWRRAVFLGLSIVPNS
jgi:hypothetical protein